MQESELVTTVYVDVIILVNMLMDYIILWAAGRLSGFAAKKGRLLLGALVGASYSLVVFIPENSLLLSPLIKVLCSVLMVTFSYAPVSVKAFFQLLGYLYLVSFAMGGSVIAAMNLLEQPPVLEILNGVAVLQGGFTYSWLLVSLAVAVLICYGGVVVYRKNWLQQELLYSVNIEVLEKTITTTAFLDTGNQLYDPLTQKPVMMVEAKLLQDLLPAQLLTAVQSGDPNLTELSGQFDALWASRLRVIPYNSVGREHGILIGLRPDVVIVSKNKQVLKTNETVIALVKRVLNKDGKYHALLHPGIFQ